MKQNNTGTKVCLIALVFLTLSGCATTVPEVELVELRLQLAAQLFGPKPPRNHKQIPNLPDDFLKPQAPLFVPKGTSLISRGRPVTCSNPKPLVGKPGQVTDGIKEGGETYSLWFGTGRQHVQIDLEAEYSVYAIAIWHEQYLNIYNDVIVQVSKSSDFSTDTTTVFNNDHDNSSGLGKGADQCYCDTYRGKVIDAKGVVGRYVRVYSNGSAREAMNLLTEVEVHGISVEGKAKPDAILHPLVGKWKLVKGRRPPGQTQFQADQYFKEIVLHQQGRLSLVRDIGTKTKGTWVYDEGDEALILKYRGGHTGAGFPAQKSLEVFSHIKLDGDTLTFPSLGAQKMIYQRVKRDD